MRRPQLRTLSSIRVLISSETNPELRINDFDFLLRLGRSSAKTMEAGRWFERFESGCLSSRMRYHT